MVTTVGKWVREFDQDLTRQCGRSMNGPVDIMRPISFVLSASESSLVQGSKNFSPAFLEGSTNLRTSSVRDHARSNMHIEKQWRCRDGFF